MKQYIGTILIFFSLSSCNPFEVGDKPTSSEKELKENFTNKEKEITELKSFFNSISPKDWNIRIEFKEKNLIDLDVQYASTTKYPGKTLFRQWNINPYKYSLQPSSYDSSNYAPETNSLDVVKGKLD